MWTLAAEVRAASGPASLIYGASWIAFFAAIPEPGPPGAGLSPCGEGAAAAQAFFKTTRGVPASAFLCLPHRSAGGVLASDRRKTNRNYTSNGSIKNRICKSHNNNHRNHAAQNNRYELLALNVEAAQRLPVCTQLRVLCCAQSESSPQDRAWQQLLPTTARASSPSARSRRVSFLSPDGGALLVHGGYDPRTNLSCGLRDCFESKVQRSAALS